MVKGKASGARPPRARKSPEEIREAANRAEEKQGKTRSDSAPAVPPAATKPAPASTKSAPHGINFSDEREKAGFFQAKTKYERFLAAKKMADANLRNACKEIRQDVGEWAIDGIKLALRIQGSDDGEADVRKDIERQATVARWMGLPIGAQGTLFDETDRRPIEDRAFEEGERAGMEGRSQSECPYDPTNPAFQAWTRGWHSGQEKIFNIKAPAEPLIKGEKDDAETNRLAMGAVGANVPGADDEEEDDPAEGNETVDDEDDEGEASTVRDGETGDLVEEDDAVEL